MFKQNRKVEIQTVHGETIQGVLAGRTRREYIIWAPKIVTEKDATVAVSGHVEIPRENVRWYSVIG